MLKRRHQPTPAALRAAKLLRHYGSSVSLAGAGGFTRTAGHPQAQRLASRLVGQLQESPTRSYPYEVEPDRHYVDREGVDQVLPGGESNARTFRTRPVSAAEQNREPGQRHIDRIDRTTPGRRNMLKPTWMKDEKPMPTTTARASISKGAAGGPWLRIKQNKLYTDVTLTVELAAGQWTSFHARIDHAMIRKLLERGGVEIGFSLGGIWKGIKKVAKATGVSKVLSIASKVLKNPIVTAVFPVASVAARATESGLGMLAAATRAKKGGKADKVAAATLIQASHNKAKGGDVVQKKALKMLSRTYRIVVEPLAVSGDPLNAFDQAA